jgi:hypothetical protein
MSSGVGSAAAAAAAATSAAVVRGVLPVDTRRMADYMLDKLIAHHKVRGSVQRACAAGC